MKTIEKTCACGNVYTARVADVKRGWAKSCSKSCAAKKREKSTKVYRGFINSCVTENRSNLSDWERQDIEHEKAMDDAFASHGQDW